MSTNETTIRTGQDRRPGWQARAQRKRNAEERTARFLESRGWLSIPPEYAARARVLILRHITELRSETGRDQ